MRIVRCWRGGRSALHRSIPDRTGDVVTAGMWSWVAGAFLAIGLGFTAPSQAQPLPEGNAGIASRYPGDVGIGADPAVIFNDDFESYAGASALTARWNEVFHSANLRIATEPGNVFAGSKAIEMSVPKQSAEVSNNLIRYVRWARVTTAIRFQRTTAAPGYRPTDTTSSSSALRPGATRRAHPTRESSTYTSTTRISATSGAITSTRRVGWSRSTKPPGTSGPHSSRGRMSFPNLAAGTRTN
jgi:hypothetical protein